MHQQQSFTGAAAKVIQDDDRITLRGDGPRKVAANIARPAGSSERFETWFRRAPRMHAGFAKRVDSRT